jgi:hypothetical protein
VTGAVGRHDCFVTLFDHVSFDRHRGSSEAPRGSRTVRSVPSQRKASVETRVKDVPAPCQASPTVTMSPIYRDHT